ncbi:MAG: DMT family transporter [Burkholderiales bacterium]|nr:DMT family transporter [Burkholderiales bacterium]
MSFVSPAALELANQRRAITLMMVGLALLLCLDASGKYLGAHGVPVGASTWSRYFGHFLFVLIVFLPRDGVSMFRPRRPWVQWVRGVMMVGVTLFYFAALGHVPLADATAIFFLTPILTTVWSAWLLGERPGRWTLLATIVGFAGVLVVARPGSQVPLVGVLLVLGAALCNSAYQTLTRAATARAGANQGAEIASTQLLWSGLVGAVLMTIAIPWWWRDGWYLGQSATTWTVFAATGILGALGHWLLIRAYQLASATAIAPWMYMQLLVSVALGWFIFGAVPDGVTLVGMVVIGLAPQLTRLSGRRTRLRPT